MKEIVHDTAFARDVLLVAGCPFCGTRILVIRAFDSRELMRVKNSSVDGEAGIRRGGIEAHLFSGVDRLLERMKTHVRSCSTFVADLDAAALPVEVTA